MAGESTTLPEDHRRTSGGVAGCDCSVCEKRRMRKKLAHYRRDKAIAEGRWEPWADAAKVREHVQRIHTETGLGYGAIGELSGAGQATVKDLIYGNPAKGRGPSQVIRTWRAKKLLAFWPTLDQLPDLALTESTGTRRRLEALMWLGFSAKFLAPELGLHPDEVSRLRRRTLVRAATARRMREVYAVYSKRAPSGSPMSLMKTREFADKHQFAPPAAWDDTTIDDPDARPGWKAVRCTAPDCWQGLDKPGRYCRGCRDYLATHGTFEGRTRSKDAQAVVEDAVEIARVNGLNLREEGVQEQIGERLGMRADTLRRTLERHYFGKQELQPCTMAS